MRRKILLFCGLISLICGVGCGNNKPQGVTHTVKFFTKLCKEKIPDQIINDGERAKDPGNPKPIDEYISCDGWKNGAKKYDFNTPVTKDLTLTPNFVYTTVTVTFDTSACEESYPNQKIVKGKTVSNPGIPTPKNPLEACVGWNRDGKPFDFSTPITENITLTPRFTDKWIVISGELADKNLNIDDTSSHTYTATLDGIDVTNQVEWSVAEGFEKVITYDKDNKSFKVAPNSECGLAYVQAKMKQDNVDRFGLLLIQVASFDKLEFIHDVQIQEYEYSVKLKDEFKTTEIERIIIPGYYHNADNVNINKITNIKGSGFINSRIKKVYIPDTVTSISEKAFEKCYLLDEVRFSNALTNIGYIAFAECYSLVDLVLPESLSSIGIEAFRNSSLYTVRFLDPNYWVYDSREPVNNESLKDPGVAAYFLCSNYSTFAWSKDKTPFLNLTEINMEKNDKYYTSSAILYSNQDVTFESTDDKVATINEYGEITPTGVGDCKINAKNGSKTYSCNIHVSSDVKLDYSSNGSVSLKTDYRDSRHFFLPSEYNGKSVTRVGIFAQSKLNKMYIPDFIEHIDDLAFSKCELKTAVFNYYSNCKSIGEEAFINCENLSYMNFPDSIETLGKRAFVNCTRLEYVNLNEGLTALESETFSNCSTLEYIVIPSTVTKLGDKVFDSCSRLHYVYFSGTKEQYNNISKGSDIYPKDIKTIYCRDGEISLN